MRRMCLGVLFLHFYKKHENKALQYKQLCIIIIILSMASTLSESYRDNVGVVDNIDAVSLYCARKPCKSLAGL